MLIKLGSYEIQKISSYYFGIVVLFFKHCAFDGAAYGN
jgi:hypothetical protein